MGRREFVVCALVVLALELLALGHRPLPGPTTAEVERIVAGELQAADLPVTDVRCVRPAADAATCIASMYDGSRTRVPVTVDPRTGHVAVGAGVTSPLRPDDHGTGASASRPSR